MKKKPNTIIITIAALLLITSVSHAQLDLILDSTPIDTLPGAHINAFKGTYEILGHAEYKEDRNLSDSDMKNGFSLSLELGRAIIEKLGIGVGATYQFPRAVDESGERDAKFNFVPLYGLVKLWTNSIGLFPFGMLQLGYNFFLGNDEFKTIGGERAEELDLGGGMYWALGGGIIFPGGFEIELLYTVNNGSISGSENYFEEEIRYSKIAISGGITF